MGKPIRINIEPGQRFPVARGTDVTASVVGALFGVNDYVSEWMLWQKHANGERLGEAGLLARIGTALEPAVAVLLEQEEQMVLEKESGYWRDPDVKLGCMLDYWCYKWEDREFENGTPLDVKCVSQRGWSGKWNNGNQIPLQHILQMQVQCGLTGTKVGLLGCFIAGEALKVFEVPFSEELYGEVTARVTDFWKRVEQRIEPMPDAAQDKDVLLRIHRRVSEGKTIDLTGDNEASELCLQYLAQSAIAEAGGKAARDADKIKSNIKATLFHKMKDAATAKIGPFTVETKTMNRKGFSVAPSESRQLSIKEN